MLDIQTGKVTGQEGFSKQVDLLAGYIVGNEQNIQNARNAEIAKLGANGVARVTALSTWLDAKGAPALKSMLVNAAIVEQFEGLMRQFASQGTAGFTTNGRDPTAGAGVTDAEYAAMTPRQKLEYAQKHTKAA